MDKLGLAFLPAFFEAMFSTLPMKMLVGHGSIVRCLTVLRLLPVALRTSEISGRSVVPADGPVVPY